MARIELISVPDDSNDTVQQEFQDRVVELLCTALNSPDMVDLIEDQLIKFGEAFDISINKRDAGKAIKDDSSWCTKFFVKEIEWET